IIKLGARVGDNAETAMIELVDFNEVYGKGKGEAKETAKRTRRGSARKKDDTKAEPVAEEKTTATKKEEKATE
ncbi:MAG TPA: 50S ribosomal protein L17, partial [Puia sp.]|nr:50S ribosomal protein L17 [Puia sp.]